ncbi:hypothetical protein F0L68_05705 [Solihabitans fulvus]|uniref:Uncharacterized protein n=1 Tax=Solihabitans fulvus TaxID=1892852 RepID=A0A5B2XL53_9PSEU|nr:hypothetical protein [Solihabitans fulvus]KAA2264598.1 hypothetical protein F0L68_05705 [Solihabitans fulvus]
MYAAFMLASGVFWTLTYLLVIRRGLADRSYGMPVVALCANLSWEFLFAVVRPANGVQEVVNLVWLALDLVIAFTVLRFGPREFAGVPKAVFYGGFLFTLVTAYLGVLFVSDELNAGQGTYAAFGQNLLMSGLFLAMLLSRRSLRGQSPAIAAAKLLGTACASAAFYFYGTGYAGSRLLPLLYLSILAVDLGYLAAVLAVRRNERRTQAG